MICIYCNGINARLPDAGLSRQFVELMLLRGVTHAFAVAPEKGGYPTTRLLHGSSAGQSGIAPRL